MNAYAIPGFKYRPSRDPFFKRIIDAVLDKNTFNVTENQLMSKSRKREIVELRHICMWALSRHTSVSLKTIGAHFSRDHSTVIHARDTINNLIDSKNQSIIRVIERIKVHL